MNVCETSVMLGGVLIAYGTVLIVPLAVIEGPIVSATTGFLSARGYFGWLFAMVLLVVGDLVGDLIYYWIGCAGAGPMSGLARRLGLHGAVSPEFQRKLARNATRMLLVGKWTHSIGCVVLVGSGMLRLPLAHFMAVNLLATLPKTALLFGLGYFAGNHLGFFERHAMLATTGLAAAGVASIALILRQVRDVKAIR